MKKLTLQRQTVRRLGLPDLRQAAGGMLFGGSGDCQKECSFARSGCYGPTGPQGGTVDCYITVPETEPTYGCPAVDTAV